MGDTQPAPRRTAGAFDIRTVIAALLGLYGLVLVGLGLFGVSDADLDRADGMNVNLWAGIGMVVVAVAFLAWARLRPIVVATEPPDDERAENGY